jgi:NTP pyrophosphatase (non-canonical NTP hydrolase)
MEFSEYQTEASSTSQDRDEKGLMISLLGLAGEVGSLLTEYKKFLRDGPAHERYVALFTEDLGDILWYVSDLAKKLHLDLDEIAAMNLAKVKERWSTEERYQSLPLALFDETFREQEQLPRQFEIAVTEYSQGGRSRIDLSWHGTAFGNNLTDNAYDDDGYRFHDVLHLTFMATLGWSPVCRKLFGRKRKSDSQVDEVEDGGRAGVIEEGLAAYIYTYARQHFLLEGIKTLDYNLLKTIKSLTSGLEVGRCSVRDWENAILQGFKLWRDLIRHRRGVISGDLRTRSIHFRPAPY